MMKRSFLAVALVIAGLAAPTVAHAQLPIRDSVTGTASWVNPAFGFTVTHKFDVSSGPSGENASGTFLLSTPEGSIPSGVGCLHVTGNRAVIGLTSPALGPLYLVVVDGGATGPDQFGAGSAGGRPATECAAFAGPVAFETYTEGNIVVTDVRPFPTTKRQCTNGGWHNVPGFKNQGQCIAFVIKARVCGFLERLGYTPKFCPPRLPDH